RSSVETIFKTIVEYFLAGFEEPIRALKDPLVSAAYDIFEMVHRELLPTPAKSHYTFNLRDIWKVFQGICSLSPKKVSEVVVVVRCWCHENTRVYGDRLINDEDRAWFNSQCRQRIPLFKGPTEEEVYDKPSLVFGDFLSTGDEKYYVEVEDLSKIQATMETYLDDYNNSNTHQMPLVMFFNACEHVARICRVIRQPSGNALLLGVGGSGRQSLSRLASFISDFECFQIEVAKGYGMNEFRDDLRKCLLVSGCDNKPQMFLFCDTQIVNEQMVEAINNVLNSGDVPNLYKLEDMDAISQTCRAACTQAGLQPTKTNLFNTYLTRVKRNIHVVLAFSPVGDAFRTRLRMFPSLVNCCTIDWFAEWPADALYSVAKQQLIADDTKLPNTEGVLVTFRVVHQSVEAASLRFKAELKRHCYVTPTSYLTLISNFKKILGDKRLEVETLRQRFQSGLDKLSEAGQAVAVMETELVAMQPVLEKTSKEVAEMMVVITEDKAKAAVTKEAVAKQEKEATAQAAVAQEIKDDAQKDLDEALPALEVAVQCLKSLKLSHIQEVKALANPPGGVKLTLEAICIMFEVKPTMKNDPERPGKKTADYWESAKSQVLSDPKGLLEKLFAYDKDNIPDKVISNIEPYINREDFDPAAIKKASVACEALCMWARAMFKYHHVARSVEPKRQKLMAAEEELSVTMGQLEAARAELKGVEDKLAKLEKDYNDAVAKQEQLKHDMEQCAVKLERANKLIGGLGGEKDRWTSNVKSLSEKYELLPGDALIAAGMVSYAGPFVASYRTGFEHEWMETCKKEGVEHSPGCRMLEVLGEPVKIQQWVVCSLPQDTLSVENAIIIDTSRRWPLM
ncbi:Dynein heavy chain 1, axonemal, partial [Perkinsus olseni]